MWEHLREQTMTRMTIDELNERIEGHEERLLEQERWLQHLANALEELSEDLVAIEEHLEED